MRPLHPCPNCGHGSQTTCLAIARTVPPSHRFRCVHCQDDCLIALARIEGRGPQPARPPAEPYVPDPLAHPPVPLLPAARARS